MSGAGELTDRVHFQLREAVEASYGSPQSGAWTTRFTAAARLTPLRGGEEVMADRLAGKQPYIVRVWQSSQTRDLTPAWRIEDARRPGRFLAVKTLPTDPDGRRQWHELLAVEGEPS